MAKNRKTQSAASRFGPALKAGLLCLLIGGSGVGYVWQKDQIDRLGKQILQRERRLAELEDQNEKLRKQLGAMRSPRFLEMKIKELNLGMGPAQQGQVKVLPEPSRELPGAESAREPERHYAASRQPAAAIP